MDILNKIDNILNEEPSPKFSVKNYYIKEKDILKDFLKKNRISWVKLYSEPRRDSIRIKFWGIGFRKPGEFSNYRLKEEHENLIEKTIKKIFGKAVIQIDFDSGRAPSLYIYLKLPTENEL